MFPSLPEWKQLAKHRELPELVGAIVRLYGLLLLGMGALALVPGTARLFIIHIVGGQVPAFFPAQKVFLSDIITLLIALLVAALLLPAAYWLEWALGFESAELHCRFVAWLPETGFSVVRIGQLRLLADQLALTSTSHASQSQLLSLRLEDIRVVSQSSWMTMNCFLDIQDSSGKSWRFFTLVSGTWAYWLGVACQARGLRAKLCVPSQTNRQLEIRLSPRDGGYRDRARLEEPGSELIPFDEDPNAQQSVSVDGDR